MTNILNNILQIYSNGKFLINHLKTEFLNYYYKKHGIKEKDIMKYSPEGLIALEKVSVFSDELIEVFYIFFFIKIVNLDTEAFEKKIMSLEGINKFTFNFFEHNSSFVEILFRN